MILFIFFAVPIATILLAIVLQKILRSPILVGMTFFAIYLIIAFILFSGTLAEAIIAVIIYSILAFITAYIVQAIKCLIMKLNKISNRCCNNDNSEDSSDNNVNNNNNNNVLSLNNGDGDDQNIIVLNNDTNNCNGGNTNTRSNNVAITARFTPNCNNNGRTGSVRGCYRRL